MANSEENNQSDCESIEVYDTTCPICFENVTDEEQEMVFICKHCMHKTCLEQFLTYEISHNKRQIRCPLCQTILVSIRQESVPRPRSIQTDTSVEITNNTPSMFIRITCNILRCMMCLCQFAIVFVVVIIIVLVSGCKINRDLTTQCSK